MNPYSSDEDILPDELPKQTFIKNGLRSNYYKTTTDPDSQSIRFAFENPFIITETINMSLYF